MDGPCVLDHYLALVVDAAAEEEELGTCEDDDDDHEDGGLGGSARQIIACEAVDINFVDEQRRRPAGTTIGDGIDQREDRGDALGEFENRTSTRLNSSQYCDTRMPSSACKKINT